MSLAVSVRVAAFAAVVTLAPAITAECRFHQTFGSTLFGGGKGDSFTRGPDNVKVKEKKDGKFTLLNPYGEEKEFTQDEYTTLIFNCQTLGQFPEWGKQVAPKKLVEELDVVAQSGESEIVTASPALDTADLDGDGVLDAVFVNARNQFVTIGFGAPGGGFNQNRRTELSLGPHGGGLRLGDLNGDGQPDLVVARSGVYQPNDTGAVAVFLGARDGSFGPKTEFKAGMGPQSVALGDFNGDGRLDAAVANGGSSGQPNLPADKGGVSILPGLGNGRFGEAVSFAAGDRPLSILAFRANADQHVDLAVANADDGTVSIFLGRGDGSFGSRRDLNVGDRPSFLGSADVNGDGRADLLVLHQHVGTISVWLAEASGGYRAHGRYLAGARSASFDMVQVGSDLRPSIISPDGTGTSFHLLTADLDGSLVAPVVFPVGNGPSAAAAADFNGDGRPDLAIGAGDKVTVILGPTPYGASQPQPVYIEGRGMGAVAAGDFNGDGRDDLAYVQDGNVFVREGSANGLGPARGLGSGGTARHLIALDVNGDGRDDLAAVKESSVAIFLNGGAGLGARTDFPTAARADLAAAAGDFNGDGRDDVLVVGMEHARLLTATAAGGLGPARLIAQGSHFSGAAAGDLNNDGKLDAVVSGLLTSATNFVFGFFQLEGDGAGGFAAPRTVPTDFGPNGISVRDFNGDGYTDLVIAHCCGATNLSYWQGLGDGTFASWSLPGGSSPTALTAADFDGDGGEDLAVVSLGDLNHLHGAVAILANHLRSVDHALATGGLPGALAPDSIISAYGAGLAPSIAAAETPDWPATLAGTGLSVRDAGGADRTARIAFASPGQVNWHLPAGVAVGPATVTLTTGDGRRLTAPIHINPIAPGLFVADADRLAAAWVIRVKPDGAQILEPVVELGPTGLLRGSLIDLSVDGDIVVLQLFGTGLRGAPAGSVTATIAGTPATALYAGPQNQFPGLDQINIEIPRSLAGRGVVPVEVTVDGVRIDPVLIRIR